MVGEADEKEAGILQRVVKGCSVDQEVRFEGTEEVFVAGPKMCGRETRVLGIWEMRQCVGSCNSTSSSRSRGQKQK